MPRDRRAPRSSSPGSRPMGRAELEAALLALFALVGRPFAAGLAELLLTHQGERADGKPPIAAWPGTSRQLRRTLERLRARGVEFETFAIGRRSYLRTSDLERLPELLADRPSGLQLASAAANDRSVDEDVEAGGERLAEQLLAAHGKRLGPRRAAGRGGR